MSLRRPRGKIVYSTDPDPEPEPTPQTAPPKPAAPGGQTVYVERDRKRRRGKTVTVISGLPGREDSLREMLKTLLADGTPFTFDLGNREGFTEHRWEVGVGTGDYGGATLVGSYLAFSFNPQLQLELTGTQFLGNASNGYAAELGLAHVFAPEWRISPLFTLGTGMIWIEPKSTLVLPGDRRDQTAYAGAGLRFYVTRRFFVRGEFRHHVVFTSRNENEEIKEWKLGLAFFF